MARYDRSKKPDPLVQQVLDVLGQYERNHPEALIEARRGNYDFIYIRIIDPDFEGIARKKSRKNRIWPLLYQLPDEIVSNIGSLVLVTPEEAPHNGSSINFDHPLTPLPIPDFSAPRETSFLQQTISTNGHQQEAAETILVPLQPAEAEAVKQMADSEGVEHSDLIRGWVQEKLQLAPSHA